MLPELKPVRSAVTAPSVDASIALQLLPAVLSVIAGSTDIIGFLGLGGLFTAHITGNLAILAAHLVSGGSAQIAIMLSVPMFIAVLAIARATAGVMEWAGLASLQLLLLIQFMLLAGFLFLSVAAGPSVDPNEASAIVAGMLGVAAMAVQNALMQISVKGAPSTAVMTTNVTRFTMDIGELLMGREASSIAAARHRATHTWPAIVGFAAGCAVGAVGEALFGLSSLVLPTGLALLAFGMALASVDMRGLRRPGCRRSGAGPDNSLNPVASLLALRRAIFRQAKQSATSHRGPDAARLRKVAARIP